MRIVTLIQARMGSGRFPGKVLCDLNGMSMLARVVRRAGRAAGVEESAVATSVEPGDDAILRECERLGVRCFRGDLEDVLDRYYHSACAARAEAVVRLTADNPLVDPQLIDEVLGCFLRERPDYASNHLQPAYPLGLGLEIMTMAALERAWREATHREERVHVTPYIFRNPGRFRLYGVPARSDYSDHRWTVDTPEDLEFMRRVYARFPDDTFGWQEVLRLVNAEPELEEVNRHVRQKELHEG